MKKILFFLMSALVMLATSCEKADVVKGSGESEVSFCVSTPEIATRSYSDGKTATVLQYAVYDKEGNLLGELVGNKTINISTTVEFRLTTGNTYSVVFWAAAENAPYSVDFAAKTMTVDYSDAVCNDENRDAFYAYHTFTVAGAQTETIDLKRPFAQLNIGTADYTASRKAGYVPTHSSINVKNVYNTLHFADGTVSGLIDEVEFKANYIPKQEKFPVDGYEYLAMSYVLAAPDKEVVDIEFTYTDNPEVTTVGAHLKKRVVGSAPINRNYRTNIYGNLLTSMVDIKVEIKPVYLGGYNNGHLYYNEVEGYAYVKSVEGLLELAAKVNNGDSEWTSANIALEGDIDLADLNLVKSTASNWIPIGTPENPFKGTFNGKGYSIKNLYIEESEAKEGKAYIGFFGYAEGATIKNVTFENVYINIPCLDIDHSQGHIGAVAGSLEGTSTIENVTVKGDITVYATQTANGASRVAVVAGGNAYGNVIMKNVHVKANKGSYLIANNNTGALAGQLQGKMHFENCSSNIDVTVNKFFAGGLIGIAAGDSKFVDCHTYGNVAVVAGRAGRDNDHYRVGGIAGGWADNTNTPCVLENCSYSGLISGKNSDGSVASPLDYSGFVGRGYTLTNRAGSTVIIDGISFVQTHNDKYGIYDVKNENGEEVVTVGSKEDLPVTSDNKINTVFEENVTLLSNITLSANETTANSGYKGGTGISVLGSTLDGNGKTLKVNDAGSNWGCTINTNGGTIKNVTVSGAIRGIFMPGASSDLFIDNVTFNCLYTFNSDDGNKNFGVYISNSALNGWTSFSNAHKEVVFTNCTFAYGCGYAFCRPYNYCVFENCEFSQEMEFDTAYSKGIVFKNCTHNGVKITAENAATLRGTNKKGEAVTFFYNGLKDVTFE